MRNRYVPAAALAAIAIGSVAHALSGIEPFHQAKGAPRQAGGGSAAATLDQAAATARSAPGVAEDDRMVPASVLADDPSDTTLDGGPRGAHRVQDFDIRGMRLGMSPREVGRIADRERFRRRWNSVLITSGSFEVEATRIANFRLNRPAEAVSKVQLRTVQAFDPAGNELKLEFTLEPGGPKLSDITYTARLDGTTRDDAIKTLIARYGPPTASDLTVYWVNGRSDADPASPRLNAVLDGGSMTLFLRQSADYRQGAKRRLEARAQQIAASKGGELRF